MPTALIVIGRFKPAWNELSEEEQAAFAARVGRTAHKVGVTPIVGYKLSTQGSFLEVWEADDKETIEAFIGELDRLGYKNYYDEVLMRGERSGNWIAPEATGAPREDKETRRPGVHADGTKQHPSARKPEPPKRKH